MSEESDQKSTPFDKLLAEGIELIQNGGFEKAIQKAQEIQLTDSQSADGFHLEAIARQHLHQWPESLDALQKAVENAPYDASIYNLRGFALLSMNRYEEAKTDFQKAIDLEDFEPAHRNLVLFFIVNDEIEKAISYLSERIKTNPNDVENLNFMAELWEKVGNQEQAQAYKEAAQKASEKP